MKIISIFCALLLGLSATVWLIQQDPWVKTTIGNPLLTLLENSFDCIMTAKVRSVNVLHPSVEFEDVVVTPKNGLAWSWHGQRLMLKASWWDIITHNHIFLSVELDDVHGNSGIEQGIPSIWEFVSKLLSGAPGLPVTMRALAVRNAHVVNSDPTLHIKNTVLIDCQAQRKNDFFNTDITVRDATLKVHERLCCHHTAGMVRIFPKEIEGTMRTVISVECAVDMPQLIPHHACSVTMLMAGGRGTLTINNNDQSISNQPLHFTWGVPATSPELHLTLPAHSIERFLTGDDAASSLKGTCQAHLRMEPKEQRWVMRGNVKCEQMYYHDQLLARLGMASIVTDGVTATGALLWDHAAFKWCGPWQYDHKIGLAQALISNATDIAIPGIPPWQLGTNKIASSIKYTPANGVEIAYHGTAENPQTGAQLPCGGTITYNDNNLRTKGTISDMSVEAHAMAQPLHLQTLTVNNAKRESLLEIRGNAQHTDRFEGSVNLALVNMFAQPWLGVEIPTQGLLNVHTLLKDGTIFGSVALQGAVRLPATYHVINDAHMRFFINPAQKKCVVKDVACSFNRGSIICDRGTLWWDDNYNASFVHLPIALRNCFLSAGSKDLCACISGLVTASYAQGVPALTGSLMLERGQLKYTSLFAHMPFTLSGGTNATQGTDVNLDLSVETKDPIRIKTMLVDTNARLDLVCRGSLKKPVLDGSVELLGGTIKLPYKPLYITRGSLNFVPDQPLNPAIELVAKNKIKQYNVALHVTGSVDHHHMMLDASPALSEEHIVGLLLVGSEEHTLNSIVPAIIMQNLKNLVTSSDQSPMNIEAYWAYLLRPLKYIHIMPSFTDQAGRGGLRGGIEIEVSDRCRASIQKNFDLTEDIRGEIEYLLSDDIHLKGIRDERGDMSAEVEMRMKF